MYWEKNKINILTPLILLLFLLIIVSTSKERNIIVQINEKFKMEAAQFIPYEINNYT